MNFFELNRAGNVFIPDENGHFVSENQRRVAAALSNYDPNLQLQWIPPDKRSDKDYAFRVVNATPGQTTYVVCFAHECDERLLARVFQADNTKGNVQTYLDFHNAAVEAVKLQARMDANAEAHEMAYAILHSRKEHYRHNGIDFGAFAGGRLG